MVSEADIVSTEPPRWLPMVALGAAGLAMPAALGWIGFELGRRFVTGESPCQDPNSTVAEVLGLLGLVQMLGWLLLLPAFIVTAVLLARYRLHWAVAVALLVLSIGLVGLGAAIRHNYSPETLVQYNCNIYSTKPVSDLSHEEPVPQNNALERTRRVGVPASRAVVRVSPRRSTQCSADIQWR